MIKLTESQWFIAKIHLPEDIAKEIEFNNYLDKVAKKYKGKRIDVEISIVISSHITSSDVIEKLKVKGEELNHCFAITPTMVYSSNQQKYFREPNYKITHRESGYSITTVHTRKEAVAVWEAIKHMKGCECYTKEEFEEANTRELEQFALQYPYANIPTKYEMLRCVDAKIECNVKNHSKTNKTRKIKIRNRSTLYKEDDSIDNLVSIFNPSTD